MKKINHISLFWIVLLVTCFTIESNAQSKFTTFDVDKHGFAFANHFKSHIGDAGSIKITTSGLCGGMAFAACDYFLARQTSPKQKYKPAPGTPLHSYIFDRQINSFASLDKYVEYTANPFGWRDEEFFYWGLEGRLTTLQRKINKNIPAPLGLANYHNDPSGHHQVLAIGYDLGGYRNNRDKDRRKDNVIIYIYDPNNPGEVCAIKANSKEKCFEQYLCVKRGKGYRITGKPTKKWRSYFVDGNYYKHRPKVLNSSTPKVDKNKIHTVVFELTTGDDDLRGGNDNIDLYIYMKKGGKKIRYCANRKKRWVDHCTENVAIRLDKPLDRNEISHFAIAATMSGGSGGDNWNLSRANVYGINGANRNITLYNKHGKPLQRFTGDNKYFSFK